MNDHYNRSVYPFITEKGDCFILARAIDDIVIWSDTRAVLPYTIQAYVDGGSLVIRIADQSLSYVLKASENEYKLTDANGIISGLINWNNNGRTVLKSTLLGQDPQPWGITYIDPGVCIPYRHQALRKVTINGVDIGGSDLVLNINEDDGLRFSDDHIDMYAVDQINADKPINSVMGIPVEGDLWLKSDAECDIRIHTGDSIVITEVSNDKL